jgi:ribosomal subunit interface protein
MKVLIQGKQMKVSDRLKDYVDDHLVRPLNRFYDNQAAELRVEFGDSRPKKRGLDMECHLTLRMPGTKTIQIEESTESPYASLDAAADRMIRACKRELDRMRNPASHHREHPLATTLYRRNMRNLEATPVEELPNVLQH